MDGSRAEMKVRALTHDDSSIAQSVGFSAGRQVKRLGRRQPKSTTRRKPRRVGSLTWNGVGAARVARIRLHLHSIGLNCDIFLD
jgi:hypothetical protein